MDALYSQYPADFKMRIYLRIAQLYLESGDAVEAEAYVNRASLLQTEAKSEELQIMYKVSGVHWIAMTTNVLEKFGY